MKRFCEYQFIVGPKKGKACGRFIRKNGTSCWQHQKKQEHIESTEKQPAKGDKSSKLIVLSLNPTSSSDSSSFSISSDSDSSSCSISSD